MRRWSCLIVFFILGGIPLHAEDADLLIADFEGDDYGDWKVTGEAFGSAPAKGTLPGQMAVTGFQGHGLVNSFHGGDKSTGTLTSPPLAVQRRFMNFLIGGGGYAGETCIDLLLDGRVVRTATGPNVQSGGSEQLEWHTWDVADLAGKDVVIQVVDRRTGGWGHINVDHIVQSNRSMMVPSEDLVRSIVLEKNYLNLPVKNGAARRRMELRIDGTAVRAFDIDLAPDEPDWWAFIDIRPFRGKQAELRVNALTPGSGGLKTVDQTDEIKGADSLYDEPLRPQFHFSPRRPAHPDRLGPDQHGRHAV